MEVGHALQFVVRELDAEEWFSSFVSKSSVSRLSMPSFLKKSSSGASFSRGTLRCKRRRGPGFHRESDRLFAFESNSIFLVTNYGKYGCALVLSTNFFSPACTAGRSSNSQKMSISCRSSASGMGLMNRLAATAVTRSNFVIWTAVARAAHNASPSPTTWLTRPICCPLVVLKLRPVSSRSRSDLHCLNPASGAGFRHIRESAPSATRESRSASFCRR